MNILTTLGRALGKTEMKTKPNQLITVQRGRVHVFPPALLQISTYNTTILRLRRYISFTASSAARQHLCSVVSGLHRLLLTLATSVLYLSFSN